MGILLFIIAVIIFVIADYLIRRVIENINKKKLVKEREETLKVSLNLDFKSEADSLKRVEVKNPRAKILCVDDEEVILDSFRKILVLDGYSIDTVESGQEALGLIQKHHYDFVFTDLKMPEMDGVQVCKSVKHLRPDIDVIIITGYASVDTAVETMKFGAMDYIEKPFTESELLELVKKLVIKREDRIKRQLKIKVNITHFSDAKIPGSLEFSIPGGVFISHGHCWASLEPDGSVFIGIDDFAKKIIGRIDSIDVPNLGMIINKDELLFTIKQNNHSIPFKSPVSGTVVQINKNLIHDLEQLEITPYNQNWICTIESSKLEEELKDLKIGQSAVDYFNEDLEKLESFIKETVKSTKDETKIPANGHLYVGELEELKEKELGKVIKDFFS
jgi:CheY-like chemotaxis protein/glycine cleavage system H lipoate-binding protein